MWMARDTVAKTEKLITISWVRNQTSLKNQEMYNKYVRSGPKKGTKIQIPMKCDMKSEKGAEGGVKPSQFPTRTHGLVSSVYERAEFWPRGKMSQNVPPNTAAGRLLHGIISVPSSLLTGTTTATKFKMSSKIYL
jgi:hypothetical protein